MLPLTTSAGQIAAGVTLCVVVWMNPLCIEAFVNVAEDTECGVSGIRETKIVGGTEAERGEFPFIVSLRHSSRDRHYCGGAILDKFHVITAAHCLERGLEGFVRIAVREDNVKLPETEFDSYQLRPKRVIVHRKYDTIRLNHDLAIIQLKEGIPEWDNFTAPVCLPDPGSDDDSAGQMATIMGWGRTSEGGFKSDKLQKVDIPILDTGVCRSRLSRWFDIHEGQMCAGLLSGEKDACQGDSGGPLVVRKRGRFILVGIVSAGVGCARPGVPGVYTRVSHYYNWIITQLKRDRNETI